LGSGFLVCGLRKVKVPDFLTGWGFGLNGGQFLGSEVVPLGIHIVALGILCGFGCSWVMSEKISSLFFNWFGFSTQTVYHGTFQDGSIYTPSLMGIGLEVEAWVSLFLAFSLSS
jgi:hypothetical protein